MYFILFRDFIILDSAIKSDCLRCLWAFSGNHVAWNFQQGISSFAQRGTAMFALLALGGDIGCSGGPTLVGMVSGAFGDNLKMGILAGIIFPMLLLIGVILCRRQKKITNYNTVKSRH